MRRLVAAFFLLTVGFLRAGTADVVINEIAYNPPDIAPEAGSVREFIELFNPEPTAVDLAGYKFSNGVDFVFPEGTILESNAFLVVARVPSNKYWKRQSSVAVVGPYEGTLSNSGERVTLLRPDGKEADSVKYKDDFPWPTGPDGYGRTVERIAWELPSDDFHSWRGSLLADGTPGKVNSVVGTPPAPVITSSSVSPERPRSTDAVTVQFMLDGSDTIDSVNLRWEKVDKYTPGSEIRALIDIYSSWKYFPGTQEPSEGLKWTEPDFDDSAWSSGGGPLNFGFPNLGTALDMSGKYTTLYMRRDIFIPDPAVYKTLQIQMYHTAGFVCYLNGREIGRANAPAVLTYDAKATGTNPNINNFKNIVLQNAGEYLRPGRNVMSVMGLNSQLKTSVFTAAPVLIEGQKVFQDQSQTVSMTRLSDMNGTAIYQAVLPALPSQTLVRFNADVKLKDNRSLRLPHTAETTPFRSYFVYDGELQSDFPVMWLFSSVLSFLPEIQRTIGGSVIATPDNGLPQVFDCSQVNYSRNGSKLKFLKGREFRGDRTLNIIPESPQYGTSSGPSAPYREHLGLWFFKEMGILAPRGEWFRVIDNSTTGEPTQRLIVQQVNEKFLEMNNRNPSGDLYKLLWYDPIWEKHTNLEEGTASITDLLKLLRVKDPQAVHQSILDNLEIEEFLTYSVTSVLLSNWDGFFNNNWMYKNPDTNKWEIIPWDLDKIWGYGDSNPMFVKMPVDFPLNGKAAYEPRAAGPVTGPIHKDPEFHEAYKSALRDELTHRFTEEFIYPKIDAEMNALLKDVDRLEAQSGLTRRDLREQIVSSYQDIKTFVQQRRAFLLGELGVSVQDWSVY